MSVAWWFFATMAWSTFWLVALGMWFYSLVAITLVTAPSANPILRVPIAIAWSLFYWVAVVLGALRFSRRRRPRFRLGHCQSCGYDLTGNVSGRCSECGALV